MERQHDCRGRVAEPRAQGIARQGAQRADGRRRQRAAAGDRRRTPDPGSPPLPRNVAQPAGTGRGAQLACGKAAGQREEGLGRTDAEGSRGATGRRAGRHAGGSATAVAASAAAEPEAEHSPDEAWIDTPRCSTCNECTQLNGKMFAYNGNMQAYIADLNAGTYAQLVEAAESCQVSIIHPGKPRNPNEPGIDALLKRAEAFI
ncbi:MAG: ferredoxin [Betaproteobacteria bacterium]|nr:ferredoxin [Betaproteobacteria bacterium]